MSSQAAPLHYYSKNLRVTAFILLFLQFFFPISVSFSAVARAAEKAEVSVSPDDMINTMSGIQALMGTDSASLPPPPAKTESFPSPDSLLPGFPVAETGSGGQYPAVHDNAVRRDDILSALPALGLPDTPADSRETPETRAAQGVSQAGQLLSADDVTEASIGYVRSIGENLLNQQINDWLNQVGHARFQLGSNKTGDADLLVPLIDNPNSLLFSQIGLRANEERTTTNLGLGYRQYEDGWMWGVNSFYDYDITGSNSRVGVGGELWADYLKFAANGYFRVTDWHQSTLHEMRDYDERPANGFDIRAEGYLPDYPQLGAFAKYEQYFGDGISLAGTTSSGELKNNPSVSTVGLSYTPFPLLTFKGETSRGDSNDSKVGMELSYRFGMPLSQQLDTGNVDLMRNLAGNRYDFVDRNYNIVMQYRKQELLRISLPDSMTAEAAETVAVTATVDKSKYGLKSIAWSAPELTARGGSIQVTSPVTINLTLPAYVFSVRANEPQQYRLSAVGTDNEGNESNTAVMWVNVKPSQETITSLTLSPDRVIAANNTDTYSATALIRNEKGEALAHRDVTFSAGGFTDNSKVTLTGADSSTGETVTVTTDANGQAVITVRSKLAGQGVLKAEMKNGNFRDVVLRFDADKSTAQITALTLTRDKAVANGQTANTALATVADQFGNAVTDFTLNSSATNGAVIAAPVQTTNTDGQTTVSFTNVNAGESVLTVSGINTQKTASAQFIADISTARIAGVVVNDDNAVADGKARNKVTVTVVDGNNNVLADAPVTITVPGTATYITQPANGLTDNHGGLVIYYTNTKAGTVNYPVSINNSHDAASLTFKADSTNPDGEQSTLTVSPKTIKADGIDAADITLVLKDKFGNEISDQTVTFTTPLSGTSISSVSDNSDGSYFATLSGTKAGETPVLVSVNGQILQTGPASVILTAGEAAQNTSAIGVDNTTYVSGTDITVTVTLKDAQGNSVSGQASALTADTVTVPNASVKAGSNWTESGEGTGIYTAVYTAKTVSTDNKAALKLSGWTAGKTSDAYAITAGAAAQGTSVIGVDNATYTAGSDITVTVTLKDAQGNSVSGQASALTADTVTVPNASVKAGSSWTESGEGTGVYTVVYTAETVSTDNKAALKLSGWTAGKASDAYAITAGTAAQGTSSVTVDNTTYVSGTDMTVMVTLKDAQGNSVSGQASALTTDTVTVPNASVKAGSSWTESGEGTGVYTAVYTAETVSTDNKAALKLSGWTAGKTSDAYAITAGTAAQGTSSIITDNATYTAGSDITVMVTLKDAQGNSVSGQASALTADTVTVPNASVKAGSGWTDNGNGTYTGLYVAKTAGTGLKAVLKLSDWSTGVISDEYSVEPDISTAVITLSWLNNKQLTLANGSDQNEMEAVVKDANGNIIPGAKFNIDLPQGVLLFGKSNPLFVNNVGVLKFEIISTNFGSPEIKATVESSENTVSTAVNFSPVNLTLKVKVTD